MPLFTEHKTQAKRSQGVLEESLGVKRLTWWKYLIFGVSMGLHTLHINSICTSPQNCLNSSLKFTQWSSLLIQLLFCAIMQLTESILCTDSLTQSGLQRKWPGLRVSYMILAHLNKMSSINYLTHQLFPLTNTPLKVNYLWTQSQGKSLSGCGQLGLVEMVSSACYYRFLKLCFLSGGVLCHLSSGPVGIFGEKKKNIRIKQMFFALGPPFRSMLKT